MRTLTLAAVTVFALLLIAGCEKTIKDVKSTPTPERVALAH